jgi:hypothetical protein
MFPQVSLFQGCATVYLPLIPAVALLAMTVTLIAAAMGCWGGLQTHKPT